MPDTSPDCTKELLQAAKVRSSHYHAYLASAIYAMRMLPAPQCPTMGVDARWNCYYNPETIRNWTVEEIATVIEHEVWHLLREHHARQPAISPRGALSDEAALQKLWNIATDCEINDDLVKASHNKLPGEAIFPKTFSLPENKLAEWYYTHIPAANNPDTGFGGSCADGRPRLWETAPSRLSTTECEMIKRHVAGEIKAQAIGTVPKGQARWAIETLRGPVIPWNRELASILKGHLASLSGRGDITYSRRHRHQSCYGRILMPGSVRLIPKIVAIVDTSGSVSDEMLGQALIETQAVLRGTLGLGVTVMSCAAAVENVQKVFHRQQVRFRGNGGTDMTVGIEAAQKLKPQVVLLITDGLTPYPAKCPDSNIRWITLVLGDQGCAPSYGKVVRVNPEETKANA